MSSYLVDRLAVGLGNKHDCDLSADDVGDVFGSEDRDSRRGWAVVVAMGGNDFSGRVWDARSPVVRPFSSEYPLIFSAAGRRYKTPYLWKFGDGLGGGVAARWLDPAWLVTRSLWFFLAWS